MELVFIILIGFVVGAVAKIINPGVDGQGVLGTIMVGIGGALLGTFLGHALGIYRFGENAGFLGAVIGAIFILMASRSIAKRIR